MGKVKGVVPGKIQKATSNFILIVWKIYQFVRNWTEHSVPFAQGKYIEYFNNYGWISTNEQILKSMFYCIIKSFLGLYQTPSKRTKSLQREIHEKYIRIIVRH